MISRTKLILIATINKALILSACTPVNTNHAEACMDSYVKMMWKDALENCQKASDNGDVKSKSYLASMYLAGDGVVKDTKLAIQLYTDTAKRGDVDSQELLGYLYLTGEGVSQNFTRALELYSSAANQGSASAQFALGNLYDRGVGAARDRALAEYWYKTAAAQGHSLAQFSLGKMYQSGEGVALDFRLAHMWFNLAASQGHRESITSRDRVSKLMSRAQLVEAQDMAKECSSKGYKDCN